jgi:hypothetical protein
VTLATSFDWEDLIDNKIYIGHGGIDKYIKNAPIMHRYYMHHRYPDNAYVMHTPYMHQ